MEMTVPRLVERGGVDQLRVVQSYPTEDRLEATHIQPARKCRAPPT
jgi:hypothetical protein